MLTLNLIRENTQEVIERLKVKNLDATDIVMEIIQKDKRRREIQQASDALQAEMNQLSKQIGVLFKEGKQSEANEAKAKTGEYKEKIKDDENKQGRPHTSQCSSYIRL